MSLIKQLKASGFPHIAELWEPFLQQGCSVYVIADLERIFGLRDDYALSQVNRLFPVAIPDAPDLLRVVPILPKTETAPLRDGHLIIIARSHSFGYPALVDTLSPTIHDYARYRFLDNQKILDRITGRLYIREALRAKQRGYGVMRYWNDGQRYVMHFSGAGALATLATTLVMTQFDNPVVKKVDQSLAGMDKDLGFIEIPIGVNWDEKNGPISPSSVEISRLEPNYSSDKLAIESKLPWLECRRDIVDGEETWGVFVGGINDEEPRLLTSTPVQVAILAAIASRTESNPSMAIERKGYISYREIVDSPVANAVYSTIHRDLVRVNMGRLRSILNSHEWMAFCNNILLEGFSDAGYGRGRKEIVFRLRAKPRWSRAAWWEGALQSDR